MSRTYSQYRLGHPPWDPQEVPVHTPFFPQWKDIPYQTKWKEGYPISHILGILQVHALGDLC